MKKKFGSWSKFIVVILFLSIVNSCYNGRINKISNHSSQKNVFFFLETFESDRIQIFCKGNKLFDSVIKSIPTTGVALIREFEGDVFIVKFNKDTIFNIKENSKQWNNFIFTKENKVYNLIMAKDTTIISL